MTQRHVKLNNSSRYLKGQEESDIVDVAQEYNTLNPLNKWQVMRKQQYNKILQTPEKCNMCKSVTAAIVGRCHHCSLCSICYVNYIKLAVTNKHQICMIHIYPFYYMKDYIEFNRRFCVIVVHTSQISNDC